MGWGEDGTQRRSVTRGRGADLQAYSSNEAYAWGPHPGLPSSPRSNHQRIKGLLSQASGSSSGSASGSPLRTPKGSNATLAVQGSAPRGLLSRPGGPAWPVLRAHLLPRNMPPGGSPAAAADDDDTATAWTAASNTSRGAAARRAAIAAAAVPAPLDGMRGGTLREAKGARWASKQSKGAGLARRRGHRAVPPPPPLLSCSRT